MDEHHAILSKRLASSINEKDSLKVDPDAPIPYECQPAYLAKTRRKRLRFLMLSFCCCFVLGNYFCYDYPAALELEIEDKFNVSAT